MQSEIDTFPGFLMSDEAGMDTLTLEDMRQMYTPKQWRKIIEEQYPDENPDEQYILCYNEHKEKEEQNYKDRLQACIRKSIDIKEKAHNGDCYHAFFRCGCIDCDFCGPWETKKYIEAIQEAMTTKGSLKIVRGVTQAEQKKLMRKYTSVRIESNPVQELGSVVYDILIETDDEIGQPYTEIKEEDIKRWLSPVYGHNKSGKLFKKNVEPTPKEEENMFEEKIEVITHVQQVDFSECNNVTGEHYTHDKWAQLVIDLSILATADLLPTDKPSLIAALEKRREVRLACLEKIGAVVFRVESRKSIMKLNTLDWTETINRVENRRGELEKWLEKMNI